MKMRNKGLIALLFLSIGLPTPLSAQDSFTPETVEVIENESVQQPEINNDFYSIINRQINDNQLEVDTAPTQDQVEQIPVTDPLTDTDPISQPETIVPDISGEMPFISEEQQSAIDAGLIDPDFLKEEGKSYDDYSKVTLRFLNKITAESETFDLDIGKTVAYGPLRFRPMVCKKSPPIEEPESAAFLQVWEKVRDAKDQWIFSGWMFASSPSLSAMEHPIYDVWVTDCKD